MGLFSHKKTDSGSGGGLLSKLRNRRSAEIRYDHIALRLAPSNAGYQLQITAADGAPLPGFETANNYMGWRAKQYANDADKEASKACWAHLKYTRVLDIHGTAGPAADANTPTLEGKNEDHLLAAEVLDALTPAAANLHERRASVDTTDPLVLSLLWFCDAFQHLETVRYLGTPYSEAFVKLFADVQTKIVFPTPPPDAIQPISSPHSPEIAPGGSTRIVSHLTYTPATGPQRVPIQYDQPVAQDLAYVYFFDGPADKDGSGLGLESAPWRKLIREVAGVLTYFQDMPPEVTVVDFPLSEGECFEEITGGEIAVDSAAMSTPASRANFRIASAVVASGAGVTSIVGTTGVDKKNAEALYESGAIVDDKTAPAIVNMQAAATSSAVPRVLPTKTEFLKAIAHHLMLNQNDPDHLKEMVGTGSPEGQIQEALSHIEFVTLAEYERAATERERVEVALETRVQV